MLAQLYRQTWGVCLQRRGSFRRRSPSALPKEFVGSNRWGKSDIIRYSMFFSVFFGGGNNIRHAKSQVCLEFGSHRQFRRCETEHVSEADLNLIGAAGISWVFASLSSPSGRWMSGKTCRNWWSRTWSTQLLGHQRAMNWVCFQTGKTEEAQSGVLTQSILKSFRYAQLKTVLWIRAAWQDMESVSRVRPLSRTCVKRTRRIPWSSRRPCRRSWSGRTTWWNWWLWCLGHLGHESWASQAWEFMIQTLRAKLFLFMMKHDETTTPCANLEARPWIPQLCTTQGMQKLRKLRQAENFDGFSNKFLDNFLCLACSCLCPICVGWTGDVSPDSLRMRYDEQICLNFKRNQRDLICSDLQ